MKRGKIIVRGGQCVLPGGTEQKDIVIDNGKIQAITGTAAQGQVINAEGCIVLPGGIDPHVHFHLPLAGGVFSADDFRSGSIAALAGGTTTIIDFITPRPARDGKTAQDLEEAAEQRLSEAEKAVCDYSLHFSAVKGMKHIADQLKRCRDRFSINSCKIYLAYQDSIGLDDTEAMNVFQAAAGLNMKLLVHCEWGEAVDFLRNGYIERGRNDARAHALSRPVWAEQLAVQKACRMAEMCGTEIYIVHISTAEGIGEVIKARQRGVRVHAEACLHHLLLDEEKYKNKDAALYIMSPPLRSSGQKEALWQYLEAGIFDSVSTDHCPFMRTEKTGETPFTLIPNGVNGVEERVALLMHTATAGYGFTPEKVSRYLTGGAASVFRLRGKSGAITADSDADLVILKPDSTRMITAQHHHSQSDYNCYEGTPAGFSIQTVLRRGEITVSEGLIAENPGMGEFLPAEY
ncbi:MAG: amidohydrolase family protein [Spirochaetales bacterium]|nr:amidohydrolase family protein [Spirochaetales bacterium]